MNSDIPNEYFGRSTDMVDAQGLQLILERKQKILAGDEGKIAARRSAGKGTARERISALLDEGSFVETDALLSLNGDYAGVVTGSGTVGDRPIYVFAQDFTVHGGAMGVMQAKKINKILDLAMKTMTPVVALLDSAGVRIDEGAASMNAFSSVYAKMVKLSGVCPMISLIMGPVIGGAAMMAQLSDLSIQVKGAGELMVYGPTVVGSLTGENLKEEDVGGADVILAQGGVSFKAENEADAIALCAELLGILPSSNTDYAEMVDSDDINRALELSEDPSADELMAQIADNGALLEVQAGFGPAMRVALCRIGGYSCGLIASDAAVNDGMIDADAALKAARFIRFCDCYDLPLVTLLDSKGIAVPGKKDQGRTMRDVSALLYAWAEATCPKISVVTGKAIGQSYIALAGKDCADMIYAWPGSTLSALTAEAAVQVLCTEELKAGQSRFELETSYATDVAGAIKAAEQGLVDDVIDPKETRMYVINALEMLNCKAEDGVDKKHGNMPL